MGGFLFALLVVVGVLVVVGGLTYVIDRDADVNDSD